MSEELLLTGLVVELGGARVLDEVSLRVAAGTRTALVGPSGAGKTTLLRVIAGLTEVSAGRVQLGSRVLDGVPAHRREIAVVFQEPRLLAHLSVAENVALPLRAARVGRSERQAQALALLEEVGLGRLAERRVPGLSGGEQQRVALARALCADPQLLLLDEPLGALDPERREELRALLVRVLTERGLTSLLVTHDRAEAAELGERVALLLDGRIRQEGPPRELFERPADREVARFFGLQLLDGSALGAPGTWAIRPEHVRLQDDGALQGRVVEGVYTGGAVRLVVEGDGWRLTALVAAGRAPAAGERVGLALAPEHLWRLP